VFSGAEAWRIGLVSELCPPEELDLVVNQLLGQLQLAGPKALAQTKQLLQDVTGQSIGDSLSDMTANRIAHVRASDEAQEGIAAFFDKRPANWVNTIQADKT
jgi:methylglutaconyl-CoA hydratase